MRLPEHLLDEAMDKTVDRCLHIDDAAKRNVAIRREALQVGAETAFSLVAKWLAATNPDAHKAFLAEFK
jgi:hypothetical protein